MTILANASLRVKKNGLGGCNGYGFPAHRGGPMWYADIVGLKQVYERICSFQKQHGDIWTPTPLLKELADKGKTFAELDKEKSGER